MPDSGHERMITGGGIVSFDVALDITRCFRRLKLVLAEERGRSRSPQWAEQRPQRSHGPAGNQNDHDAKATQGAT
jgi:hypothetical protein